MPFFELNHLFRRRWRETAVAPDTYKGLYYEKSCPALNHLDAHGSVFWTVDCAFAQRSQRQYHRCLHAAIHVVEPHRRRHRLYPAGGHRRHLRLAAAILGGAHQHLVEHASTLCQRLALRHTLLLACEGIQCHRHICMVGGADLDYNCQGVPELLQHSGRQPHRSLYTAALPLEQLAWLDRLHTGARHGGRLLVAAQAHLQQDHSCRQYRQLLLLCRQRYALWHTLLLASTCSQQCRYIGLVGHAHVADDRQGVFHNPFAIRQPHGCLYKAVLLLA